VGLSQSDANLDASFVPYVRIVVSVAHIFIYYYFFPAEEESVRSINKKTIPLHMEWLLRS
jgi:hypothetical protein